MAIVRASRDGFPAIDCGNTRRNVGAMDQALSKFVSAHCDGSRRGANASYMHGHADAADIAEHAQIALDLGGIAGGLFRIVRQFHRRPAID